MHPLISTNLQEISDKELQEKLGMLLQKLQWSGRMNNMPLYNQVNMAYQMYVAESQERAIRNQKQMDEAFRKKAGLPIEEPPNKNLTLD